MTSSTLIHSCFYIPLINYRFKFKVLVSLYNNDFQGYSMMLRNHLNHNAHCILNLLILTFKHVRESFLYLHLIIIEIRILNF